MTITALPTPPSRSDPSNFSARADAFMTALPTFVTETNATAVAADADAASALASKIDAAASVTAANASANVTKWISGTTYSAGVVVWSPQTFFSYRRKFAGADTDDPSIDSFTWVLVSGAGNVQTDLTQTLTNKTLSSTCVLQGNAATATKLSGNGGTWQADGTFGNVVGQLAWIAFGNNHTIFDASNSTAPNGSVINNINPTNAWQFGGGLPTLMGWNGSSTWGVRVDSARYADTSLVCTGNAATATSATTAAACTGNAATATKLSNDTGSAPSYSCRAWVNFNGTGTVAIRASGNVSSITDNGVGDYTVNFTTSMPDVNFAVTVGSSSDFAPTNGSSVVKIAGIVTNSVRVQNYTSGGGSSDPAVVNLGIFR